MKATRVWKAGCRTDIPGVRELVAALPDFFRWRGRLAIVVVDNERFYVVGGENRGQSQPATTDVRCRCPGFTLPQGTCCPGLGPHVVSRSVTLQ